MKYWAYLFAKLTAVVGILIGLRLGINRLLPFLSIGPDPFAHDLTYTFVMLLFTLTAIGLVWAAIWDQRYRCRTCLRRLRMPIRTGSWTHILLGAPHMEYICPYGHGNLRVAELQLTGRQEPDWQPHDDMWTELFSLEDTKK